MPVMNPNYSLPGILAGARQLERDGRDEPVEVRGTLSGVIDRGRVR